MRTLKALIVDDEKKIVRHLKSVIAWESYGIEQVEEAFNGAEALDKAQAFKPDVILCDIRMPVMDGLAFLARLREVDQDVSVILLTAYQDFEYARSAIRNQVADYILKPIDYEYLSETIGKLVESIRERSASKEMKLRKNAAGHRIDTPIPEEHNKALWSVTGDLLSALKCCDSEQTDAAIQQLAELLHTTASISVARSEQMAHFTALHLLREMRELEVIREEEERDIWESLDRAVTAEDMLAVIKRITELSMESAMHRKSSENLMLAAQDYIRRRLSDDLGIDELAGHLGISASYFSLLFKQHFGETFVEYMTRQRMEMAKSLLLMTDKSITEIGRSVGYAERRYFTKVFQRYTGDIPSVYREKRMREA